MNPNRFYEALKNADEVPHAFGAAKWWGKEVFGADNLLVPTWPITEIRGDKPYIVSYMSLFDWLKKPGNKEILEKYLGK